MSLGCGEYVAVVQNRGGASAVGELQWSGLNFGRVLDEISSATISVGADGLANESCCAVLSRIKAWKHELAIYRDGDLSWVGPIGDPSFETAMVTVPARDLAQWFERRSLPTDRTYVDEDLGTIFGQYVTDALSRDTSPNITALVALSGVTGDRTVAASAKRRAADELRELSRSGVDFTMVGRRLYAGGIEIGAPRLAPITTDVADNPSITPRGLAAASEVSVVGARQDGSDEPLVATVGGVSTEIGLVEQVYSESSIRDTRSLRQAAQTRYDLLVDVPDFVECNLLPEYDGDFEDLIPGALVDVGLVAACREAVGVYRLVRVAVSAAVGKEGGITEVVRVTLEPPGTEAA